MELRNNTRALLTEARLKAPNGLRAIPFFHPTAFERGSFSQFLLESRILPAQRLQALHTIGLEKEFLVGYENLKLERSTHTDEDVVSSEAVKTIGPYVLTQRLNGEILFETILARFAIAQIAAQDHATARVETELSALMKEHRAYLIKEEEILILTEPWVIITQDTVFTDDLRLAAQLKDALAAHITDFEALLQNQGLGVPHALYTGEFLRWFPGHVRIRTLSDLRE